MHTRHKFCIGREQRKHFVKCRFYEFLTLKTEEVLAFFAFFIILMIAYFQIIIDYELFVFFISPNSH